MRKAQLVKLQSKEYPIVFVDAAYIPPSTKKEPKYFASQGAVGLTTYVNMTTEGRLVRALATNQLTLQQELKRLDAFLTPLGYELTYVLQTGPKYTLCVMGSSKTPTIFLGLETAVSIYNYGLFFAAKNDGGDTVLTPRFYPDLSFTPEQVESAYASKDDDKPLTLQRCNGGVKIGYKKAEPRKPK